MRLLMNTEHLSVRLTKHRFLFSEKAAAKTVHYVLNGFVPNQYLAVLHAFAPVKLLAQHPLTENALIHIPTRISECIRGFREIRNTGITFTSIEYISKEQYFF